MIVVCLKWAPISGQRRTVAAQDDPTFDDRFSGVSLADQAALETALVIGTSNNQPVTAITAGPEGSEQAVRDALSCGASRAMRVHIAASAPSREVASALARSLTEATVVVCGDQSSDRGSATVPAYLAHLLGATQALGLIDVRVESATTFTVVRRLDGGRREILSVPRPCVLSVEGSVAKLRRAPLQEALASRTANVEVVQARGLARTERPAVVVAFRPRSHDLAAPTADDALHRIRQLTQPVSAHSGGETVALPPREAAEHILRALRRWSYLA